MQTKIIALAVAGLVSGAAFAQTNVTLYGVVDQAYTYVSGKGIDPNTGDLVKTKYSGIRDGGDSGLAGSRVGVRGEENLGNGLKAVFTWEWNLNASGGTQSTNARQSFVGLAGGFGTVTLGRQDSPTRMWAGGTSVNGITGINASNNLLNNNIGAITDTGFQVIDGGGTHSRWSNSIKWVSPNWSGVQVVAHYGFAGDVEKSAGKATTDSSRFGLGVKYANGPIYFTATYQKLFKDKGDITTTSTAYAAAGGGVDGAQGYFLGGSYDFKVVKLYAAYAYEKDKVTLNNTKKHTYWHLGLGVPVTKAGTVQAEYAQYKNDPNVGDEGKLKSFSLGYLHNLSKRTALYAYVSRTKNDGDIVSGISIPSTAASTSSAPAVSRLNTADESVTALSLGIRHSF